MMMEDKSFDLNAWVLDVDLESLMNYTECKDSGLGIHNIYLSDVALAVHVSCRNGFSGSGNIKEHLGRLLRFLSGCAGEVGFVVPVLCVIDARDGKTANEKTVFEQWAADQDWHRGDFSIIVIKSDQNQVPEDIIRKMLGGVATAWPSIELEPHDLDAIINSFESERRSRQVSDNYASLLAAMAVALREESGAPISKWLDERISDVRRIMAGSDINGS
ncbi:hypothetical protein [Desulfofundulus luciae]|nr:hypothetical protein [Desulfofundulus luciae]